MSIAYSIEPYGREIVDAYARLFPSDADKTAELLDWRFAANPHGPGQFAIARDEGVIGGMIALVPTAMSGPDGPLDGFQAIDTIVNPQIRGKFVFMRLGKLAEEFCAARNAMLWGFPNAQAARGWFGRLDWRRTGSAPFLIRPLRSGYVLRRLAPGLGRIDLRLFARPRSSALPETAVDARYGDLWASIAGTLGLGVDRTGDWLRWRLTRPGADYRFAAIGDKEYVAAAAITTAHKHGGTIAYVMEALARRGAQRNLTRLLRDLLAEAGESGAEVALAWCRPSSLNYRAYRAAGFMPFPDRLRPIEIHHGSWVDPSDQALKAQQEADWYLSYLDSDTV
jgi:hypothetical protein